MNKITLKTGIIITLTLLIAPNLFAIRVSATTPPAEYAVLAPLPGVAQNVGDTTTLERYLPAIFNLAIGLAAVAAVLNIVIGGFQYMTTDAIMKKGEGIKRIQNAVFSLVLIISAWIILYTINPKLLEFNLNITPATVAAPPETAGGLTPAGVRMTTAQIAESSTIRAVLYLKDIYAYRDPCTEGQTTECVNLNGIRDTTIQGLSTLKLFCPNCSVVITGGTEGGHSLNSTHYSGIAVDLRKDSSLTSLITSLDKTPEQTNYGIKYDVQIDGKDATFLDEGDHWHVTFQ